jgi:hypothetical protein
MYGYYFTAIWSSAKKAIQKTVAVVLKRVTEDNQQRITEDNQERIIEDGN